jgi:iron complex transport system substrate-binding protein
VRHRSLVTLALAALTALLLASGSASAAKSQRIVALTPFTANTVASLGVLPKAYGIMPGSNDTYVKTLTNNKVPTLELSHPNGPNMEELAKLNPTLVLTSPQWSKGTKTMKQLGMKVEESDPQTVGAVPNQTRKIGRLIGRAATANSKAAEQERAIKAAKSRVKGQKRQTVLLVLGVGRTPYAFLPNSWGGDVIKQAGGTLLTEGLKNSGGFARISNEFVAQRNPDVIIAVPHGTTDAAGRKELAAYLKDNVAWKDSKAVQSGRLVVWPDNTLLQAAPAPGAATVINKVQKILFPGLKNR